MAYGLQFPEREPLSSADFRGGTNTVKRLLTRLGFVVQRVDPQRTGSGAWVFRDGEDAYLNWLKAHPEGLVVNAERDPSPGYLPLHRTTCWTINERNSAMAPGAFTKDYIKVCALDHETLLRWIAEQGGESFTDYCSKCEATRAGYCRSGHQPH